MKYVNDSKGMNLNEYIYWKEFLSKNLKVGTEIELEFNTSVSRSDLSNTLKANGDTYSAFGTNSTGIYAVKSDGSLRNGLEIVNKGRFYTSNMEVFHEQYKLIFDNVKGLVKLSNRTGMHQHVLIAKRSSHSELESKVPDLFFKNLMIMLKNYCGEIHWLTSAMYSDNFDMNEEDEKHYISLRRYDGFYEREFLYDLDFNEATAKEIWKNARRGQRYKCYNLHSWSSSFDRDFHIEFRLPDGAICPSQITIQNYMWEAIIQTALESCLGGELLDIFSVNSDTILNKFANNPENETYPPDDYRYSMINPEEFDVVCETMKKRCEKFVEILRPKCSTNLYKALKSLAEENISLRLKRLYSLNLNDTEAFKAIENNLYQYVESKSGIINKEVYKLIKENKLDVNNLKEIVLTSKEQNVDVEDILFTIERLKDGGIC